MVVDMICVSIKLSSCNFDSTFRRAKYVLTTEVAARTLHKREGQPMLTHGLGFEMSEKVKTPRMRPAVGAGIPVVFV
jgi:hypothetical protein